MTVMTSDDLLVKYKILNVANLIHNGSYFLDQIDFVLIYYFKLFCDFFLLWVRLINRSYAFFVIVSDINDPW